MSSLFVSASHLTRNSPIIFVLHDVSPARDNQGRRGSEAHLDGLLVCSFAFERVKKLRSKGTFFYVVVLFVLLLLIINICSV